MEFVIRPELPYSGEPETPRSDPMAGGALEMGGDFSV
jgi:hypothetical protein